MRTKSLQSFMTLCNPVKCQAPLSIRFSRHWDLPNTGIKLHLLCPLYCPTGSLPLEPPA